MEKQSISEFETFVNNEVQLAAHELAKFGEESRKHLQKLVYTNLIDRFDSMIDHFLLDNSLDETLLTEALSKLETPMSEASVFRLLLDKETTQDKIEERIKNILRNGVLTKRHSQKLSRLFEIVCPSENVWNKPRVNPSTGKILEKYTPQTTKMPSSVCGYADWLYSRRNTIVHGNGTSSLLNNDVTQIKKLFKCTPAKTIKLKLSAITVTSDFYLSVTTLLKANI